MTLRVGRAASIGHEPLVSRGRALLQYHHARIYPVLYYTFLGRVVQSGGFYVPKYRGWCSSHDTCGARADDNNYLVSSDSKGCKDGRFVFVLYQGSQALASLRSGVIGIRSKGTPNGNINEGSA